MKYLYILLLSCLMHTVWAQNKLSAESRVSLVTIAPGTELYSFFGHTLIRVYDPATGLDRAYSFGTFDFQTENFYWKFLKGTLPYSLSYNNMSDVLNYYSQYENRTLREQVLALNEDQKNQIFQALEKNYLPENRYYQYKFFYDNCATRIRDIFEHAAPGAYPWATMSRLEGLSYRDWMNRYLPSAAWVTFGMNLALGLPSDVTADASQSCYLPDNLEIATAQAMLNKQKLVEASFTLFEAQPNPSGSFDILGPIPVLLAISLVLVILSLRFSHKKGLLYGLDIVLFFIYGLFGILIFFLATATDHEVMSNNVSCFILWPIHFPLVFWFAKNHRDGFWLKYVRIAFIVAFIASLISGYLFYGLFIIALPLLVRLFFLSRFNSK